MRYEKTNLPPDIIQVCNMGPREFLGYIKNAAFIVTNSFHGTALSIIMEKQFVCIPPVKTRERTDSIMRMAGLVDHIIEAGYAFDVSNKIDYVQVNRRIDKLRHHSTQFLLRSLASR